MLYIQVEAVSGDDIHDVAQEMVELSNRLNVGVQGKMNGQMMWVIPGDNVDEIISGWRMLMGYGDKGHAEI